MNTPPPTTNTDARVRVLGSPWASPPRTPRRESADSDDNDPSTANQDQDIQQYGWMAHVPLPDPKAFQSDSDVYSSCVSSSPDGDDEKSDALECDSECDIPPDDMLDSAMVDLNVMSIPLIEAALVYLEAELKQPGRHADVFYPPRLWLTSASDMVKEAMHETYGVISKNQRLDLFQRRVSLCIASATLGAVADRRRCRSPKQAYEPLLRHVVVEVKKTLRVVDGDADSDEQAASTASPARDLVSSRARYQKLTCALSVMAAVIHMMRLRPTVQSLVGACNIARTVHLLLADVMDDSQLSQLPRDYLTKQVFGPVLKCLTAMDAKIRTTTVAAREMHEFANQWASIRAKMQVWLSIVDRPIRASRALKFLSAAPVAAPSHAPL